MASNYQALTAEQRAQMLSVIGISSVEELFAAIPKSLRNPELDLPDSHCELEVQRHLAGLASQCKPASHQRCFLGGGSALRFRPSAIGQVAARSEFLTSYTPYQPEISQGTLQVIYEFQSLITSITGMDAANASMYDGASATAEAALMALRVSKRSRVLVSGTLNPEYEAVVRTYAEGPEVPVARVPSTGGVMDLLALERMLGPDVACLIIAVPNALGCVEDAQAAARLVHSAGGLLVVVADPISLAVLKAPRDYGADIVVGDGQQLGNALSFGGPHLGFMACNASHLRQLPGRICGRTTDSQGRSCFTLTLQAREQHIRRERAASNICTNQAWNALVATLYLSLVGKKGLGQIANTSLQRAHYLADRIALLPGFRLAFPAPFFNEFVVEAPVPAQALLQELCDEGILGGVALEGWISAPGDLGLADEVTRRLLLVTVTETNSREDLDSYVLALDRYAGKTLSAAETLPEIASNSVAMAPEGLLA